MNPFKRAAGWVYFILFLIIFLPLTVVTGSTVILFSYVLPKSIMRRFHKLVVAWGYIGVYLLLSPPKVYGKVSDKKSPAVIISNHQSQVDILIAVGFYPVDFLFMSKKEVFKIPFVGGGMKKVGYISIDRGNPRAAAMSVKEAIRRVKEGNRVLIYPEGTRSNNASKMLPFKAGALKIAAEGSIPILPIVVYGTQQVNSPKFPYSVWPHKTAVSVLKPIEINDELHPANTDSKLNNTEKLEKIRELLMTEYARLDAARGRLKN